MHTVKTNKTNRDRGANGVAAFVVVAAVSLVSLLVLVFQGTEAVSSHQKLMYTVWGIACTVGLGLTALAVTAETSAPIGGRRSPQPLAPETTRLPVRTRRERIGLSVERPTQVSL